MHFLKRVWLKVLLGGMGIAFIVTQFPPSALAQRLTSDTQLGTPAYSYYLAESIVRSYQQLYHIKDTFEKKPISHNLRPHNVYERALGVMEEFDTLFPGVISQGQKAAAYAINPDSAGPTEISGILTYIRDELQRQGSYQEYEGTRTAKTPNDVYQIMRRIGWHHLRIAEQLHIETTWDSVDRVYETVVLQMLPTVYQIVEKMNLEYQPYAFPKQPRTKVLPRNIYKLVIALYKNVAEYYRIQEDNSDMLKFVEINDCDDISPADVYDLEQVVAAEFRLKNPSLQASSQIVTRYEDWKFTQNQLVPGHTFRLLQHLYILTQQIHRTLNGAQ